MLELVSPAPTVIVPSAVSHFKTTMPEPPALPSPAEEKEGAPLELELPPPLPVFRSEERRVGERV